MIANTGLPYLDTDSFIDIEKLKSLHGDIIYGICVSNTQPSCYSNLYDPINFEDALSTYKKLISLDKNDPRVLAYDRIKTTITNKSFNTEELLTAQRYFLHMTFGSYSGGFSVHILKEDKYQNKNLQRHCKPTGNAKHFPSLLQFIYSLPFSEIGRLQLFVNYPGAQTPIHSDNPVGTKTRHCNDMLWLRTNYDKKLFILDPKIGTKYYITSHSAFFNEQAWHGTEPSNKMVFSIRVDGVFTQDFKAKLGLDKFTSYNEDLSF